MGFGGNLAVRNINSKTDSYEFTFESSEAVEDAVLDICMAPSSGASTLSDIVTVDVNETDIDTTSVDMSYDSSIDALGLYVDAANYKANSLRFKTASIEIDLREGKNIITFESFGGNGGNFDYIELSSPSTISGYEETDWAEGLGTWAVTTAPTTSETGILECYSAELETSSSEPNVREYVLPTLSEENGYIVEGEGDTETYSFYVFDQKFEFYADGSVVDAVS